MKEEEIRSRSAFARYLELVQQDISTHFTHATAFHDVACPGCEAWEHASAFEKAGFRYVTCQQCGTLFASPRPTASQLKAFYLHAPSSQYWVNDFFRPVAEARRVKIFRPRAVDVAQRLSATVEGLVGDIGAGFGLFLEELRALWPNAKTVAIEPSAEMAAICRAKGLQVLESTIEDLQGYDGQFGLLTTFELLEHLYEPRALLDRAWQLLRPGGYLVATTLNGEGFDIQILWERSKSIFPPHHINFLNPGALATLCERAGFQVEEITTPGRLDWDIIDGALREGIPVNRFWSLLARQGTEACKQELQSWIAQHGLSSHMRLIARKR